MNMIKAISGILLLPLAVSALDPGGTSMDFSQIKMQEKKSGQERYHV